MLEPTHQDAALREGRPPWRAIAATITAIAAAYVYFLIFAEFAFIEIARSRAGDGAVRTLMAALGTGGIVGSLLGARHFSRRPHAWPLAAGFAACGCSAGLAMVAPDIALLAVSAVLAGLSLGWTTVTLALHIGPTLHGRGLGLACGSGTGIAYTLCNQPGIFDATAVGQTWIAMIAAAAGLVAAFGMRSEGLENRASQPVAVSQPVLWIVLLFLLVWLDSAAFFVIQHTPALKTETWQGNAVLLLNAASHLGGALLAGWLLDRFPPAPIAAAALSLLIAACWLLQAPANHAGSVRLLYTVAVSIYSAVLVFVPAKAGQAWFAGALYAVAGWVGSALGIGMAQDLRHVPTWFLFATVGIGSVAIVGVSRLRQSRHA